MGDELGMPEGGSIDDGSALFVSELRKSRDSQSTVCFGGAGNYGVISNGNGAESFTQSCPPKMIVSHFNCRASSLMSSAARLKL